MCRVTTQTFTDIQTQRAIIFILVSGEELAWPLFLVENILVSTLRKIQTALILFEISLVLMKLGRVFHLLKVRTSVTSLSFYEKTSHIRRI